MDIDLSDVASLYSENVEEMGHTPESVGWNDEASQRLRFERLARVVEDEEPITVNDLGCGYGALYVYLVESADVDVDRYVGYDVSDEMVAEARRLVGDSDEVEVRSDDRITEVADYSFASGIFNVRLDNDEAAWEDYVRSVLANMAEHSTRGFAFNVLTTHVDYREDHLYYADPSEYLDHCLTEFSRSVALYHDYDLYEWTIAVSL